MAEEIFDIVDENGKPIGKTVTRAKALLWRNGKALPLQTGKFESHSGKKENRYHCGVKNSRTVVVKKKIITTAE